MTRSSDAAGPAPVASGPRSFRRLISRLAGPLEGASAIRAVAERAKRISIETRMTWLVLGFALVARLLMLDLPNANGDGPRKWMWARVVRHGWSPSSALWEGWDHHAARLSINVPTLAVQWLFGDHPALYFVTPLCAFLLSLYCLFRIALRCGGVGVATWSGLWWAWFAPSYWVADLMPSAFSPAYSLASILCAIRLVESTSSRRRVGWLLAAALCMMLAELAKVTNLFFVPGMMLALWASTKQLRWPLGFALAVSALLGVEWLAYQWSPLDAPLGRVSIILTKHLGGPKREVIDGIWGLVTRQSRVLATSMPGLYIWLLIGVGSWALVRLRERPAGVQFVVLSGLGYVFLYVFAVSGVDPLRAVQPAKTRYIAIVVPLAVVAIGWWLAHFAPLVKGGGRYAIGRAASAVALLLLTHAYAWHYPGADRHPFARLERAREMVHTAYEQGMPILARGTGRYVLHGTTALFWDDFDSPYYRSEQQTPRPGKIKTSHGKTYRYLFDPEKLPSTKWSDLRQRWGEGRALVVDFRSTKFSFAWKPFSRL